MKIYNTTRREFVELYTVSPEQKQTRGTKYDSVEVSLVYRIGGMNYFIGKTEPRCYALCLKPCTIANGFRSTTIFGSGWDDGVNVIVVPAARFSQAAMCKIAERIDAQKMGKLYAENNMVELQAELENIRV